MPDEEDDEQGAQPEDDNLLQQALAGAAQYDMEPAANPAPASAASAPAPAPVPPPPTVGAQPLGRRMAPAAPGPQPPADSSNAAPEVNIPFDMSKMPPGLLAPPVTPASVPRPPTGSNNPTLADLAREQAMHGKPLDPSKVDPATGKPIYKMGVGGKILGTLANFASGFSRNPGQPIYVGPGATNARYARDEAQREGNLANVNTQIGTQEKLDTENQKMYEDAIKQAYEGQLGEARLGLSKAAGENADTRTQLADSTSQLNEAKEELTRFKAGQTAEPKTEAEIAIAKQLALQKGDKGKAALYDGALKELAKQKQAGKDTTASDVAKAIQVATYRTTETNNIQQEQTIEQERRVKAEVDGNPAVKYDPAKRAAAIASINQDLQTKYGPRLQDVNDQADKMLGLTKAGARLQSGSRAAPKGPPKVGETIMVAGKPRKVIGFNQQTKKPIVAPAGQ